jgi:DNA-directed RNA polymerase specialized sigma24 family protein
VARISLNMLRSRDSRREQPLGMHVLEPIVDRADGTDPEHEALLADSVGLALLVVLEMPSPTERLAFALHDIFACPSTRSRQSSIAPPRRPASWRAAPAAACG